MKDFSYIVFCVCVLTLAACKKDTPDCVKVVTEATGSIDGATTWDACHIYHVTNQLVVKATLTIEPETIVKLDAGASITVTSGKIVAEGKSDGMIVFTSWKDDNAGGDNNADGSATTPAAGDWKSITLGHSSDNKFNFCKVMYGAGSQTPYWSVVLGFGDGANNSLTNSVIANNTGAADQSAGAVDMTQSPVGTIASANTFYNNFRPIAISNVINFDLLSVFHNPDNPSQTNVSNGVFIHVYLTAPTSVPDITYLEDEVPFVFASDASYTIPALSKIILGPEVVFKFGPSFTLNAGDESQIVNRSSPGVRFTSIKDDSVRGDTNGDGVASAPANGDWDGIWNTALGDYFDWPNIAYDN